MKIDPKILSIPPYISTSWKNIASLHVENHHPSLILVITLLSGARIEVPNLDPAMLESIFTAHSHYMELEEKPNQPKAQPRPPINFPISQEQVLSLGLPFRNSLGGIQHIGSLLQHNPEQADSPDLPPDILQKIAILSKSLGVEDPNMVPKPEPHCNCMHCQIAKALQIGLNEEQSEKGQQEEEVSDEDLKFKTWDVAQTSEKLYVVTNPLDNKEHYNVYLGDPIGCTCGENHCEHIRAVLNT
jgi:hypothetical protein